MTTPVEKKRSLLPFMLAFAAGAIGIYWFNSEPRKDEVATPAVTVQAATETGFSKALATGPMAGVIIHPERKDIPPFSFANAKGETVDLSKWKGRVVLLNLWATWCAPCRKEMPDLAKLQTTMGGPDFEVVALSVDRKGLDASLAFLKETGVNNLAAYIEPEAKSLAALQALGLPATVLIDKNGKEAGRLLGPADWSSGETQAMVKALLAEK
jgi:thiol-disulfide isomerase/thioredoxin